MYKKISMFQNIRDFKTRLVLTTKFISVSKETLKLLLNSRITLFSNNIQLLQKEKLVNYFFKNLNNKPNIRNTAECYLLFFMPCLKHYSKSIVEKDFRAVTDWFYDNFMILYQSKCHYMRIGKNTESENI